MASLIGAARPASLSRAHDFLDDGSLMPGVFDGEFDLTPRQFLNCLDDFDWPMIVPDDTKKPKLEDDEKRKAMRFPAKLVEILSDKSLSDVIRWEPDTRAVVLSDARRFVAEVVPKYFAAHQAKSLKTFHRQLNYYGFEVLRSSHRGKTYVNRDPQVKSLDDFHRLFRHRSKPAHIQDQACAARTAAKLVLYCQTQRGEASLPCPLPNF